MKIIIAVGLLALMAGAAVAQDNPAAPAGVSAVAGSSSSTSSAGMCTPPSPPAQWSPLGVPEKPAAPSCLNLKTHISTCSRAVLDRYNTAVQNRNDALQKMISQANDYVQSLNDYNHLVNDYSNCEVKRLNGVIKTENEQ